MQRPLIILWMSICLATVNAFGYSGGTGEPNDPYRIATAQDLINLGHDPCNYDKHFILTADIDLSGYVALNHLDGTVQGGSYYVGGLIGVNLGEIYCCDSHCSVSGFDVIGGLVGYNMNGITVACLSTGTVHGNETVGGLIGWNELAQVVSCYSVGAVTCTEPKSWGYCGGLVGGVDSEVSNCFWDTETSGLTQSASGIGLTTAEMKSIHTYLSAGWDFINEAANGTCDYWQMQQGAYPTLVWDADNPPAKLKGKGTLNDPYLLTDANDLGVMWYRPQAHYQLLNDISLNGITWNMAVVPWFGGYLDGSRHIISHLKVDGSEYLGLIGELKADGTIENLGLECVDINGLEGCVGALAGDVYGGHIRSCYSTGTVQGRNDGVGGFIGRNYGYIIGSFWNLEISGLEKSDGGTGLLTAQMQDINTFLDAGWDFVDETANGTDDIWTMPEGDSPRLWWEK